MIPTWYKAHIIARDKRRLRESEEKARTPDDWRRKVAARDNVIKERDAQLSASGARVTELEAEIELLLVGIGELKVEKEGKV